MCGIAGVIDLAGKKTAPHGVVQRMADAIIHRGPDEDGYLERPGLHLANRRLSIIGLQDGKQPISNEDQTVWVVFNGEFFEYPEKRAMLEAKGHVFRTHTDTELIPHMWEEYGEGMFEHLRGQFAICLWDSKKNCIILARDRIGICPLFWSVRKEGDTNYLLFGSEVKALLASGMVPAVPDHKGLNQIFTFFALPGPMTCFQGVQQVFPGRYLRIQLGETSPETAIQFKKYWELDFPDYGQEENPTESQAVEQMERLFMQSVERRLRADVPVAAYLSGGVDSSLVVAVASKVLGRPIPTFTIAVQSKGLNEENEAMLAARHVGSEPIVLKFGHNEVRDSYPELIRAAEFPVVDTSSAALIHLARSVRDHGYKVALTGEGSDEFLAGYPWFKINKILSKLDFLPGIPMSTYVRQIGLRLTGQPRFPWGLIREAQDIVGGHNGWMDVYGMMSLSKLRFFSEDLQKELLTRSPYGDLDLNRERLMRWHPFHRSLALGVRIMLAGHLLASKGDRVAMHSSVETRPPFLDDDLIHFMTRLHPRWKLRGLRDKYILRKVAERWVPLKIARRKKAMFLAPMDSFHLTGPEVPKWINQVLSPESLKKTGYFNIDAVTHWREALPKLGRRSMTRRSVEMGLVAVTSTQLWHHQYISGNLTDCL